MKTAVVCLLLAATATGLAQWREATVWLPDSLVGLDRAQHVSVNPTTGRVCIYGFFGNRAQVWDPGTGLKSGYLRDVTGVNDVCYCPGTGTAFAVSPDQGMVAMIDAAADTVMNVRWWDDFPMTVEFSPTSNLVYLGGWYSICLSVLDPATGAVVDTVESSGGAYRLEWDSTHNRLYACHPHNSFRVVDCSSNTFIAELPIPEYPSDIVLLESMSKLYCTGRNDSTTVVWVYDTDSLAPTGVIDLPLSRQWYWGKFELDAATGCLYVFRFYDFFEGGEPYDPVEDTFAVIDCATDSVIAMVSPGAGSRVSDICCPSGIDKVYVGSQTSDSVAVLGVPDSITGWVDVGHPVVGLGYNPSTDELYCLSDRETVTIVDMTTDSVIGGIDYRYVGAEGLFWNSAGNELYAGSWYGIGIVDSTNRYDRTIPFRWNPERGRFAGYSADHERLYLRTYSAVEPALFVFDCATDTVIDSVPLSVAASRPYVVIPEYDKMYVPGYQGCAVYDLNVDSVLSFQLYDGAPMRYNPHNWKVYGTGDGIVVIDARFDLQTAHITGYAPTDLAISMLDDRVWFTEPGGSVRYVDGTTDEVVPTSVRLPRDRYDLVWVEGEDKLYAAGDSWLASIDCATRTLLDTWPSPLGRFGAWLYNPANNKLYAGGDSGLIVLDCRTDSVVAEFTDVPVHFLARDPVANRVYAAADGVNRVDVYRDVPGGVQGQPAAARSPAPTVVRGTLFLPGEGDAVLVDITGRRVGELRAGSNDIGRLRAGVYFVCPESGRPGKVVVTR